MNNLQCRKAYVRVNLDVDEEGTIIPMLIRWKDGRVFQVEQLKYKCRASSNKVGGGGIRYTVIIPFILLEMQKKKYRIFRSFRSTFFCTYFRLRKANNRYFSLTVLF